MIHFDINNLELELKKLEDKISEPNFWEDSKNSNNVLQKIKKIKNKCVKFKELKQEIQDTIELIELVKNENDKEMENEIHKNINELNKKIEKFEIETLLSGKFDKNNAILTLHPGAGGTEAQDWAEMLYRMYSRWAIKTGYKIEELDYLEGDEAGLKSVTFEVSGENAYGYLKGEMGVHRLVRISPFDSGGRRHTSFASLEVIPEIEEDIEIDINPDDIKMDVYRASGAGRTTCK